MRFGGVKKELEWVGRVGPCGMGTVMTRATSYLAALSTICEPSVPFENRVGLGPEIRQFYCPRLGSPQQSTATDQASLLLRPVPGFGLQVN
ncbi:hypothetical protein FIBSPDRAFT_865696 [Athelia psychrophila]|uniref:Uncharacterized protein n=1 Tax=Athelia psychrophila TaxID=1759441 RepID=A0A166FEN5_9AGAM|nr:hypothetical protein FIBSPDRAFT_865696 [Fibularhizoctonia sp. CBS 109695]